MQVYGGLKASSKIGEAGEKYSNLTVPLFLFSSNTFLQCKRPLVLEEVSIIRGGC